MFIIISQKKKRGDNNKQCYWYRSVEILFESEAHFPEQIFRFSERNSISIRTFTSHFSTISRRVCPNTSRKIHDNRAENNRLSTKKAEFGVESMWKCDATIASSQNCKSFAQKSWTMSWKVNLKSSISHPFSRFIFPKETKFIQCVDVCVVL